MDFTYSVVVPVRNEAELLPSTVTKLLAATENDRAQIVWVCNGCSDNSADVIRKFAGSQAAVIEIAWPGKIAALQAGDDFHGNLFPRLYLDADTWLQPGTIARLLQPLLSGEADLVAPRLSFDTTGASRTSARIGACWLSLPHARETAFSNAIGVSAAARGLWQNWPEVTGDDIFVSATVPASRRRIVSDVLATTSMPTSFAGWVRMRARWMQGESELARLGLSSPRPLQQRRMLLCQIFHPATASGACAFVAARLAAGLMRRHAPTSVWIPDRVTSNVRP